MDICMTVKKFLEVGRIPYRKEANETRRPYVIKAIFRSPDGRNYVHISLKREEDYERLVKYSNP